MGEARDRIDRIIEKHGEPKTPESIDGVTAELVRALADELDATQKGLVNTAQDLDRLRLRLRTGHRP